MNKMILTRVCFGLMLGFNAIGCGDDDTEDDEVTVDVPGVEVTKKELTAAPSAGAAAAAPVDAE